MSDKEVFLRMSKMWCFNELAWKHEKLTSYEHICEKGIKISFLINLLCSWMPYNNSVTQLSSMKKHNTVI